MTNKIKKRPLRTPAYKKEKGACLIPGAPPTEALAYFVLQGGNQEAEEIRSYVEWQASDETVKHLEKVSSENVFGQPMDAWDVRTNKNRWWVITNPTNLYSQRLFPSLDYTLSFHVGVTTRMAQSDMCSEQTQAHDQINELWGRLADARAALFSAQKGIDFQSVGMKCRECLLFLVQSLAQPEMVPEDQQAPQRSNFKDWCEVIANYLAPGSSNERIRSYLKSTSSSTWELTNWLTHTLSAEKFDGIIAIDATESVLQSFIIAAAKHKAINKPSSHYIKSIKTKKDYQAALKKMEKLMCAKKNTPEGYELDILATLVEAYEQKHFKIDSPKTLKRKTH